jgi:acyl carrier protein
LYEAFSRQLLAQLEPVQPYRKYLEWLNKQPSEEAHAFWRNDLAGFCEPTLLPSEPPDQSTSDEQFVEHVVQFTADTTAALQTVARKLQLTVSTVLQGCWALLLNRQSNKADVVFGAAFSGRPTDLPGAESIVGPFVNNLPVRVKVNRDKTLAEFLYDLHKHILELNSFQFTPLMDIQRASEVPWRYRLFDSLIVFQNYLIDESARRFGGTVDIVDFIGPIHTNYPVLLLAEPGTALRLTLKYDRQRVARAAVERWGQDLTVLVDQIPTYLDRRFTELQDLLSLPVASSVRSRQKIRVESQNYVPPQTAMEKAIAEVWQKIFGTERISIDDNLFEMGGHSLLLVQMHSLLRDRLGREFPIVTLFMHSTVRSLARYLEQSASTLPEGGEQWRARARQQKEALAQLRVRQKTKQL